jgi:hypothetical protein
LADGVAILEEAISDVGLWSWWTANLPTIIQVEFSGTLLWNPSLREGGPPSGQIALRFLKPSFVGFLTRQYHSKEVPSDWPERLQNDQMESLTLSPEAFTLSAVAQLEGIISGASRVDALVGDVGSLQTIPPDAAILGFWAGPIGLAVVAKSMGIFSHTGELSLEDVVAANQKWWEYWREYWQRKDTDDPMPEDYACEVTIPAG